MPCVMNPFQTFFLLTHPAWHWTIHGQCGLFFPPDAQQSPDWCCLLGKKIVVGELMKKNISGLVVAELCELGHIYSAFSLSFSE